MTHRSIWSSNRFAKQTSCVSCDSDLLASRIARLLPSAFFAGLLHLLFRLFLGLDDVAQVEDWKAWQWELHRLNDHAQEEVPAQHVCRKEPSTGADQTCGGNRRHALGSVEECTCRETKASRGTDEDEHEDQVGTQCAQQENYGQDAQSDGIISYATVSNEEDIGRL
jgi:hypothetical protein